MAGDWIKLRNDLPRDSRHYKRPHALAFCRVSRWTPFDPVSNGSLPSGAGVYVIYWDDKVVYIGSASSLNARMKAHRCGEPVWMTNSGVRISGKFCRSSKYGEWLMVEARLIRRIKPKFNKRGVNW